MDNAPTKKSAQYDNHRISDWSCSGCNSAGFSTGDDFYASAFVSVDGQYFIDLPPGNYIVHVAYPDGTDKVATVDIQRGSDQLNFAY